MGVNVCLQHKLTSKNHPDWDDSKFSVDKTIVKWLSTRLPFSPVSWDPWTQDEPPRRPSDFDVWRQVISSITQDDQIDFEFMKERLTLMVDLLESNPDYGVYISC